MASSADVRDIMGLSTALGHDLTKEMILGKPKVSRKSKTESMKKPEGMARELYNLLYNDSKDAPSLIPSDSSLGKDSGYKQLKARLGMKKVRSWSLVKFNNPARNDGLLLHHWRRLSDDVKEYPFARFNKKMEIPSYSETEYQNHLLSDSWSRGETDHLMDLASRFDCRFLIIHDRWSSLGSLTRSVEDLKERYYFIVDKLEIIRKLENSSSSSFSTGSKVYDADHERKRKEQLIRLYNRTPEQIEEEEMLRTELRKIETRKREREKKTQDLQKLIDTVEYAANSVNKKTEAFKPLTKGSYYSPNITSKKKAGGTNSSSINHQTASSSSSSPFLSFSSKSKYLCVSNNEFGILSLESSGIKWPELPKGSSVTLRSSLLKVPSSLGSKKIKALETLLSEFPNLDSAPMPTEEIVSQFNDLRSELLLLFDLRNALSLVESELTSTRGSLDSRKNFEIPEELISYFRDKGSIKGSSSGGSSRFESQDPLIDVVGNGSLSCSRKRKAALEQNNVLKKIKNRNF